MHVNSRALSSVILRRRESYYVTLLFLPKLITDLSYTVLCHVHFPTAINKINIDFNIFKLCCPIYLKLLV